VDALLVAHYFYLNVCTDGTPNQVTCEKAPLSGTCEWDSGACKQKSGNAEQDIASKFSKWKTLSDATMDAFEAMTKYDAALFTETATDKQCKQADNTHTAVTSGNISSKWSKVRN